MKDQKKQKRRKEHNQWLGVEVKYGLNDNQKARMNTFTTNNVFFAATQFSLVD